MRRSIIRDALLGLASSGVLPHRLRPAVLRACNFTIAAPTLIMNGLAVAGTSSVTIGANTYINRDCYFDAEAAISIGENTQIGDHVKLITSSHSQGTSDRRAGKAESHPIRVGAGCWIGSGAIILPGVQIANGCIIAAGAVVHSSTEQNGLYAGVPARRKRDLQP